MKIINIVGSPRPEGNCATIAKALLERLQGRDVEARTYVLNNLTYRGCQGCMACKTTSDKCVVQDDLAPVLEDFRTADTVFFSSPIYGGEITAQAKGLVDRFYSFLTPDFRTNPHPSRLAPGKTLVFIVPQGNPDASFFTEVITRYQRSFARLGFKAFYTIRAVGAGQGNEVLKNAQVVQAIDETVKKITAAATTA